MVYCEIDDISRSGKLDLSAVEVLGELVDILKDIGSIEMFEEYGENPDDGYSFASGYARNGYAMKGNSYRNSYNDGRGRSYNYGYSRRGGRGGYSRDDSKEYMIQKLEMLKNEAMDDKDRQSIQMLIEQMYNK